MPEITPVAALRFKWSGKRPAVISQVMGGVPVATKVWEYCKVSAPLCSGEVVMISVGFVYTTKVTSKFSDILFAVLYTVTVAVYVPADKPVIGATVKVKVSVALGARLFMVIVWLLSPVPPVSAKLAAFVPLRATVRSPVAWLPMFSIVTSWADISPAA